MVKFEKSELSKAELDIQTLYRFAEIEINRACDLLAPLFPTAENKHNAVANFIIDALAPGTHEAIKSSFMDVSITKSFTNPSKQEIIHYLRYNGASYGKIYKLTNISPNTVSAVRYETPYFVPIWPYWDPITLNTWNQIAPTLNLWGEKSITNH